jgi:single-stranded-DNA-specific exonuclease
VAKRLPGAVLRFGGHAFAAGLTLREEALAEFGAALEAVARERLTQAELRRVHESDGALAAGELTFEFCRALGEPVWGQGLAPPAFDDVFDVVAQRPVGDGHARLTLARSGERFGAIAFRTPLPLPPRIHALYRPELRHFQDLLDLTLVVDYWTSAA